MSRMARTPGELHFALCAQTMVDLTNVVSINFERTDHSQLTATDEWSLSAHRARLCAALCGILPDRQWVLDQTSETACKLYCHKVRSCTESSQDCLKPVLITSQMLDQLHGIPLNFGHLQGLVSKTFKCLSSNQCKLELKLPPLKEAIVLSLQTADIQRAALASLRDVLLLADWFEAGASCFIKHVTAPGQPCGRRTCVSLKTSLEVELPAKLIITCRTRTNACGLARMLSYFILKVTNCEHCRGPTPAAHSAKRS